MHGRIATYRISGDPHELARKAEEGMLPIFQAQPGFRAYNLALSGDILTSMSAWDTVEEAEAATPAAASWIAENIADDTSVSHPCARASAARYSSLRTLLPPYARPELQSSRFAQMSTAPPRCSLSRSSRWTGDGPKRAGRDRSARCPLLASRRRGFGRLCACH